MNKSDWIIIDERQRNKNLIKSINEISSSSSDEEDEENNEGSKIDNDMPGTPDHIKFLDDPDNDIPVTPTNSSDDDIPGTPEPVKIDIDIEKFMDDLLQKDDPPPKDDTLSLDVDNILFLRENLFGLDNTILPKPINKLVSGFSNRMRILYLGGTFLIISGIWCLINKNNYISSHYLLSKTQEIISPFYIS